MGAAGGADGAGAAGEADGAGAAGEADGAGAAGDALDAGAGSPGSADGIADGSIEGEGDGLGVMQGGVSTTVLYLPLFVVTLGVGVAAASQGTAAAKKWRVKPRAISALIVLA